MSGKEYPENPLLRTFDRVTTWVDIAIYGIMICVVLLQIVARVLLPKVPPWTEELSRYLQVYLVAVGAGLAIKHDSFVSIETIFHYMKNRSSLLLKIVGQAVNLVLFVFFFVASFDMYQLGIPRTAVTMPSITMNMVYFSMILMSFNVILHLARKIWGLVQQLRKGG